MQGQGSQGTGLAGRVALALSNWEQAGPPDARREINGRPWRTIFEPGQVLNFLFADNSGTTSSLDRGAFVSTAPFSLAANFLFARHPTGIRLQERQLVSACRTDNQAIGDRNPAERSGPKLVRTPIFQSLIGSYNDLCEKSLFSLFLSQSC